MAARRGVACSGVSGVVDGEDDMFVDCSRIVLVFGCARDTSSQGVGSRDADAEFLSAKEQLLQAGLHVWFCLVVYSQTSGV